MRAGGAGRSTDRLAVVVEGFALPLVYTGWITALAFTVLNAWLLAVRIRCENRALATVLPADARA